MPNLARSRVVQADPARVWAVIDDPHHLPRWWPEVRRVEGVGEDRFTEVLYTRKGRPVRVDFVISERRDQELLVWEQELLGTPFERVVAESIVEIAMTPEGEETLVCIRQRQRLRGYSRLGGWMLRRATRRRLDEALDGLASVL